MKIEENTANETKSPENEGEEETSLLHQEELTYISYIVPIFLLFRFIFFKYQFNLGKKCGI